MKIICENKNCIYWENYCCKFVGISADAVALCSKSINADIDNETLERIKEKYLLNTD